MKTVTTELPYRPDSADLFEPLADQPWAMFLDSGRPWDGQGRYDILVAAPIATVVTRGAITEVRSGQDLERSTGDPLRVLQKILSHHAASFHPDPALPFSGGAVGYFAYDLGRRYERIDSRATDVEALPEMAVGIYDWAVVVDHVERRGRL